MNLSAMLCLLYLKAQPPKFNEVSTIWHCDDIGFVKRVEPWFLELRQGQKYKITYKKQANKKPGDSFWIKAVSVKWQDKESSTIKK